MLLESSGSLKHSQIQSVGAVAINDIAAHPVQLKPTSTFHFGKGVNSQVLTYKRKCQRSWLL